MPLSESDEIREHQFHLLRVGISFEYSDYITPIERQLLVGDVNDIVQEMNKNKADKWRL